MTQELTSKPGWRTLAIGRHLIDVPVDAALIQQWKFGSDELTYLPIRDDAHLKKIVEQREAELRAAKHETRGSMFIDRWVHAPNGVTLLSYNREYSEILHRFESYFRAGNNAIKYVGTLSPKKHEVIHKEFGLLAQEWRAISPGQIPTEPGYVAGDMLLMDSRFNYESWSLYIKLANKPDVSLEVRSFVVGAVKPDQTLRKRAGGILVGMLGMAAGLHRLRNRERQVGPIWAEEILVAGTQDGKRGYGFKWEAPGKEESLAEPQLNIALEVSESAYKTNAESFKDDDEALALWDTLVESIRLRPGAV